MFFFFVVSFLFLRLYFVLVYVKWIFNIFVKGVTGIAILNLLLWNGHFFADIDHISGPHADAVLLVGHKQAIKEFRERERKKAEALKNQSKL